MPKASGVHVVNGCTGIMSKYPLALPTNLFSSFCLEKEEKRMKPPQNYKNKTWEHDITAEATINISINITPTLLV